MRDSLLPSDRELLLTLYGYAQTIQLRLDDLGDELELDSELQQSIQQAAIKAHTLLAYISSPLIE
jgi:hypothetical protein